MKKFAVVFIFLNMGCVAVNVALGSWPYAAFNLFAVVVLVANVVYSDRVRRSIK